MVRDRDTISVWDLESRDILASVPAELSGTEEGVAWGTHGEVAATDASRDGAKRVVGYDRDLVEQWSVAVPLACAIAFVPCGERLAVGSWKDGAVFDIRAG